MCACVHACMCVYMCVCTQISCVPVIHLVWGQGRENISCVPFKNRQLLLPIHLVWGSPLAKLPQGSAPAQAQVVPQELQLLPAPLDEPHLLHMLIQRSVHQLQVDEGLGPDLRQESQGLPADLEEPPGIKDRQNGFLRGPEGWAFTVGTTSRSQLRKLPDGPGVLTTEAKMGGTAPHSGAPSSPFAEAMGLLWVGSGTS